MAGLEMKYDGEYLLSQLKTLKTVKSMNEVSNITHTQYPGTHCPLMGALLVARGISDSLTFVVGTDECVYYSKRMTMVFDGFGGMKGRCVSVRLDTHDVTFGSAEKVEEAFEELMPEYKPSCIFLISTCVIEIIGDDFDAIAKRMQKKYNIPVLPIHTEHFKCEDHLPGIQRAMTACADLMQKQENNGSVNVLGQRMGDFTKSELYRILNENNIKINIQLPKECSIAEIKTATRASLNIVVNETALELAEKMKEKFGVDYIIFYKYCSHETNYNVYKELFAKLNKEIPQNIILHYEKAKKRFEDSKNKYNGLRYIYGGSPFTTYENIKLMCELGLEPLLLQISRLEEQHLQDIEEITKYYDPYVTRTANVTGIMQVYDTLKPDLNFGPAYMTVLKEKNIVPARFDKAGDMIGLELCDEFLDGLEAAQKQVEKIREKR